MSKETPLVKQYNEIKADYPDTFLFFRLGDFYELFGDDAIKASKIMEVTLTKRRDLPMCGVPYHSAMTYIRKILKKSMSVAICEQTEDASRAKGLVKREVVRVITPGTIIEDDLLSEDYNNFLAGLSKEGKNYGLTFLDVSTGDFKGCSLSGRAELESELSRIPVKEIVISGDETELENFININFPSVTVTKINPWYFTEDKAADIITGYFDVATLKGWEIDEFPEVTSACGGLIEYLKETQKEKKSTLKTFQLYRIEDNMVLDRNAQENLELVRNLTEGTKKNTLYDILDYTDTAMGKRKLVNYILRPLKDVDRIRKRLNAVEELIEKRDTARALAEEFEMVRDIERILSRTGFGNCNGRDLVSLKESQKVIPRIKEILSGCASKVLKDIAADLSPLEELADELERGIVDSPPLTVKEGGIIKKGYDKELDKLIDTARADKKWIADLEKKEKERLKIPPLKVSYNKVYGYYIEVTKTHADKVPAEYNRKQTLVNAERYITKELKDKENSILGAEEKKSTLEYKIFKNLREKVNLQAATILKNAELISVLDVLKSFAEASVKNSYVKPSLNEGEKIEIKDGRHPVVEPNMGINEFIPNDTLLDKESNRILIITGPNMAGKSTYLKQTAIISIMAQAGCFVPAAEAEIGVIDRVFTRIGAGENLAGGESTFMVEMTEAAAILNNATSNSLIILDEVGRGTSTFDGISIAWAVIESISKLKSRTLFATHYFELTELASYMDSVTNYNFAVREWKDRKKIVFLRKLKKGSGDKSYGIHCAELAGVPQKTISRAWEIFRKLEEEEFKESGVPRAAPEEAQSKQMGLFKDSIESIARQRLEDIDLNNITPLELVEVIKELKEDIEDGN
ncbi:MAG: DNA mismatch repair protein MutS [Elusimicrobiota bacterium]|nr:DNA mismatch repair protein MutS [Elusimicrobiota bacterium]